MHVSGLEIIFWGNFIMVLHGFAPRSPRNTVLRPKTLKYYQKPKNKTNKSQNNPEIFQVNIVEACRDPCGAPCGAVPGSLYIMGGSNGMAAVADCEFLNLTDSTKKWEMQHVPTAGARDHEIQTVA